MIFVKVGSGLFYCPTEKDAGKALVVEAIPVNDDGVAGPSLRAKVGEGGKRKKGQARPSNCIVQHRPEVLDLPKRPPAPPCFSEGMRVMSYNILLDQYCANEWCLKNLYPFCEEQFAQEDYRRQLLVRDISFAQPDLLICQEVNGGLYKKYLKPALAQMVNLDGHAYAERLNNGGWGQAVFYRKDKFISCISHTIDLNMDEETWKKHPIAKVFCERDDSLADQLSQTKSIAQICELTTVSNAILVVCNLHLYSHPMAPHIRMLQAAHIASKILPEVLGKHEGKDVSVIVSGDFNAGSDSGVFSYLTKGVDKFHPEWAEAAAFKCVAQSTKDERQDNWYKVLREGDVVGARYAFAKLQESCGTTSINRDKIIESVISSANCEEAYKTQAKEICLKTAPESLHYVDFFTLLQNLKGELAENFEKVVGHCYGSADEQKAMDGKLKSEGSGYLVLYIFKPQKNCQHIQKRNFVLRYLVQTFFIFFQIKILYIGLHAVIFLPHRQN